MSDAPDYSNLSLEEVESEIVKHKDTLCRKVKQQAQIKEEKKETAGAFREQLKEIQEEMDFELGVLDELTSRKKMLEAGNKF